MTLTLQKPARSSSFGIRDRRTASTARRTAAGSVRSQVTRDRAPCCASVTRCIAAISHSSSSGVPPRSSAVRSAEGRTPSRLACIAAASRHDVVTMQRPVPASASIDSPRHPSIACSSGMTSSRT